jgi:hypothetical protein
MIQLSTLDSVEGAAPAMILMPLQQARAMAESVNRSSMRIAQHLQAFRVISSQKAEGVVRVSFSVEDWQDFCDVMTLGHPHGH